MGTLAKKENGFSSWTIQDHQAQWRVSRRLREDHLPSFVRLGDELRPQESFEGIVHHRRYEVEVGQGKKAIVIFVPVPQLNAFQKIQTRLVRELEKKFSGKHVVFIAQRRILPKPTRKANKLKQKRPRSRTLMAVHNAILDDLVYPAEIVGKRIRIRLDGTRLFKVHLDKTQQTNIEHKTDTFANVYKKLTGKEVTFEFPEPYL